MKHFGFSVNLVVTEYYRRTFQGKWYIFSGDLQRRFGGTKNQGMYSCFTRRGDSSLKVNVYVYLFIYFLFIYLLYLFIFIYLFICLLTFFTYILTYLFIFIYLLTYLTTYLFIYYLFIYLFPTYSRMSSAADIR